MFNSFTESLSALVLKAAKKNKRIQFAIFFAIVFPVILIAAFAYIETYQDLTEFTLSRRQSIAHLAANALEQRFERLTDIGISLATRVRFRQLVGEGRWDDAIDILKDVQTDFPFIDRLFLADPAGTLMADTPALPGVKGKSFAFRDWFRGVSKNWQPYISEVCQRAAEPRFNVVAVAVPIKAEEKRIVGILILQVQLNGLVGWSQSIEVGPAGFLYFVDRNGRLATHPKLPSHGEIVDYSSVPVVQKVLRAKTGVEINFNPLANEEQVAAYAPVPGIGWGVIATESTRTAFAQRNKNLQQLLIRYGVIFLISCVLAYVILRTFTGLRQAEEKIQKLHEDLQHRAIELEAANKELEAFSYSVSHDLRAPLRSIDGFSQALLEDYPDKLDDQGKDYLKRVCASTQHMAALIDDLLNLSRVSRREIRMQTVNLSAMAQTIAAELQESQPERQVEFIIAEGLVANGDEGLIRAALQNLLANAWKFTGKRSETKIQFGINQQNGKSAYFVRDNGAGFDMTYAKKLFGAFQRLHGHNDFPGTGIGLATVQRIIRRHGGKVWAEGAVEKGATFYFTLSI